MPNISDYRSLRDRPFLTVEFSKVPSRTEGTSKVRTERQGWMHLQGNLSINEHPTIIDRVTDKVLIKSGVIIDVRDNVIIKNTLSDADDKVLEHFVSKYSTMIAQGKTRFNIKHGQE